MTNLEKTELTNKIECWKLAAWEARNDKKRACVLLDKIIDNIDVEDPLYNKLQEIKEVLQF